MSTSVITCVSDITVPMVAKAPGKIILSGEHAVVYGADALAVAVQQYTYVRFTPTSQSKAINTLFSGLSTGVKYPVNALSKLKHTLDARFDGYTKGELPVQNILNHPNDLAMYALSTLMQQLPSRQSLKNFLPKSGVLRSDSEIPMGSGMGSSAAAIAATLVLYEDILEKPLTLEQRYELVRFCERLQHGKGSAIDAATVTFGGVNYLRNQHHENHQLTLDDNWYWLHTGTPQSTTGECVSLVRKHYSKNNGLWSDFNAVTQALMQDLPQGLTPMASIKENHQLLIQIGVVSTTAQKVIKIIEKQGGCAKVSGAGTIMGEKSGLILAYIPNQPIQNVVDNINNKYHNYVQQWGKIVVDNDGAMRI